MFQPQSAKRLTINYHSKQSKPDQPRPSLQDLKQSVDYYPDTFKLNFIKTSQSWAQTVLKFN